MRNVRFPIAAPMGIVLAFALGFAALRNGTEAWAGATFLFTSGVLCLAIVGFVCGSENYRAWWLGFALFGWGYLALAFWFSVELPTMALLDTIGQRFGMEIQFSGGMGGMGGGMRSVAQFGGMGGMGSGGFGGGAASFDPARQKIAHCFWALLAALVGGILAHILFGGRRERAQTSDATAHAVSDVKNKSSLRPAIIGLAACVVVLVLGLLGSGWAPGFWAGAAFLTTCGMIAIAVLGATCSQGKRRQLWLGAALFGIGYTTVAFGRSLESETWPVLPTDHLLEVVRNWLPQSISGAVSSGNDVISANARIRQALGQTVPMRFPQETPLEDLLRYIQISTQAPDGKVIPIYVDPIGMQEAEKTVSSTVIINLEGVALRTSLRLCLEQLDLTYAVRDGLLLVTSEERRFVPLDQDPFLIVGHCLIALLAASLGAMLAPFVSGRHFYGDQAS
jgi:hypothetical protein